jgi:hypothetical protein
MGGLNECLMGGIVPSATKVATKSGRLSSKTQNPMHLASGLVGNLSKNGRLVRVLRL